MAKLARPVVAGTLIDEPEITPEELQLAVRNHSMPLEALRYDITPVGLHYQRSLPLPDAIRDEVLLAWAINGQPLTPQHGFPLRLIVPGWYGMTQVKWLRSITVLDHAFEGYQQAKAYHYRREQDQAGEPVTRMLPRALMVPPGVPDFMTRTRFVEPGRHEIVGRAWSGRAAVSRVELSDDGGATWSDATLGGAPSKYAWRAWSCSWNAMPGEHELCVRATDAAGNVQPSDANWNLEGVENNAIQRVQVVVGPADHGQQVAADAP